MVDVDAKDAYRKLTWMEINYDCLIYRGKMDWAWTEAVDTIHTKDSIFYIIKTLLKHEQFKIKFSMKKKSDYEFKIGKIQKKKIKGK